MSTTSTFPTASTGTNRDAHDNPMSGDGSTVAAYDRAIDRLLRFDPEVVDLATGLLEVDDPAPMAHVLMASLSLMSTDPDDVAGARRSLTALDHSSPNERESAHGAALGAWAAGDWHLAARRYDQLLDRWPTDLLALMIAHQVDFFVGDAASLRDRPLRTIFELDPHHPHRGFVDGMTAFGFEESGHYGQAEAAAWRAVDAHPEDVWAIHALTHTLEMTGRVDEGIDFLTARTDDWGHDNLFMVHNWWHLALFQLETGRIDDVLRIFDTQVHPSGAEPVLLEMLDAAALLWRLLLDGVEVGDRFDLVADLWSPKVLDEPWYGFNDFHAVVALVGAGRLREARTVIDRLEAWLGSVPGTNVHMTSDVALPASRAVVAFGEGRYEDAVAELAPMHRSAHTFGGSHAQRDIIERTLLEASLRAGCHQMARSLTAERVGRRETSVYGWAQRARALRGLGADAAADAAASHAAAHRDRFRRATA